MGLRFLLWGAVSPGFEFEDFELASRGDLTAKYPALAEDIAKLTEGLP